MRRNAWNGYEALRFSRQFIAGSRCIESPVFARHIAFDERLHVSTHRLLEAAMESSGDRTILALGHVLDPASPASTNREVVRQLVESVTDFESFEHISARLAGRWVIFLRIGGETQVYPDTGGTRAIFFVQTASGDATWVGSQPALLAEALGIEVDRDLAKRFHSHRFKNSWPGDVTPYRTVRQLLPNHCLDIQSGLTRRFWPRRVIQSLDVDAAAREIGQTLHGVLAGMIARGRVALPLTGGYDSRVLFACAGDLQQRMSLFSIKDPETSRSDTSIPKTLARTYRLPHRTLRHKRFDDTFWRLQHTNTSDMWWDPGSSKVFTFGTYADQLLAVGSVSEVLRCYYYKNGVHPPTLSGDQLAAIAGYEGNPIAVESFSRWLAGVPGSLGVSVLDLFYWEHRVGNWVAMVNAALDTVLETIPPYNCRRILEAGLAVDTEYRKEPHALHRRICASMAPEIAAVPFNQSRGEDWEARLLRFVPWRFRNAVQRVRLKMAGVRRDF